MKVTVKDEYIPTDDLTWQPFTAFADGGVRWKLLHVSPELGTWTALFDCPEGSSIHSHIHVGPGEYYLTKGRMEVRGGSAAGGVSACAPSFGYEAAGSRHDKTTFTEASEFYMTFFGPVQFIDPDGSPIAVIGPEEAQGAWEN